MLWDFLVDGEAFLRVRGYDPAIHASHAGGLGRTGPGGGRSVRDHTGKVVAALSVPADFERTSIHGDYVIGVRRDELDVESVRVHRGERQEGP